MTRTSPLLDLALISERYFAAWTAHDVDAIVALHTPGGSFQAHGRGDAVHGSAALHAAFTEAFSRYPGFDFVAHRVLFGDQHWTLDWTLTFEPPGRERRGIHCLDVVEVADNGLISRKDTFFDFVQLKAAFEDAS